MVLSSPTSSGVSREPDEGRLWQCVAHVEREDVVLAAVRLVRYHDNVGAVGQLRVDLPMLGAEFLDEREEVPMVLAQEVFEVFAALRPHLFLVFGDRADIGEIAVDLVV